MKTFQEYLNESVMKDDVAGTVMEYSIRKPSRTIPVQHVWLGIIRTPDETQKRKGGASRLVDNLKALAKQNNLPIYLDPIGPKAREFFSKRGFMDMPDNPKIMYYEDV